MIYIGGMFMKKSSHSTGHIHDLAFKIAYKNPLMVPDLLRLFCEDTTLAKMDLDKIRIETPSYIAGKKNLHCDLVVSAPFLSDPERKALCAIWGEWTKSSWHGVPMKNDIHRLRCGI